MTHCTFVLMEIDCIRFRAHMDCTGKRLKEFVKGQLKNEILLLAVIQGLVFLVHQSAIPTPFQSWTTLMQSASDFPERMMYWCIEARWRRCYTGKLATSSFCATMLCEKSNTVASFWTQIKHSQRVHKCCVKNRPRHHVTRCSIFRATKIDVASCPRVTPPWNSVQKYFDM